MPIPLDNPLCYVGTHTLRTVPRKQNFVGASLERTPDPFVYFADISPNRGIPLQARYKQLLHSTTSRQTRICKTIYCREKVFIIKSPIFLFACRLSLPNPNLYIRMFNSYNNIYRTVLFLKFIPDII